MVVELFVIIIIIEKKNLCRAVRSKKKKKQYDPDAERDVWSRPRSKGDDSELSARQEAERRVER